MKILAEVIALPGMPVWDGSCLVAMQSGAHVVNFNVACTEDAASRSLTETWHRDTEDTAIHRHPGSRSILCIDGHSLWGLARPYRMIFGMLILRLLASP